MRVVAPLAARAAVADLAARETVVLECLDGDPVLAAAATGAPIGPWLEVSPGYPGQIAARDLAALSHLTTFVHAVMSAERDGADHAALARALWRGGPVTLANAAATLVGAYSRPVPARPLVLWVAEGETLVGEGATLALVGVERSGGLERWRYRD